MYLLLAENNYISSREIKTLLAKNGLECEVVKCSSSNVLLDIAEKLLPDIIIIDFDLCLNRSEKNIREIRMLSPKAYILAFVSADYFEKVAKAIKTGIDDYMIKPLRREDVIMRLILGLQRRTAQSEQPDFPAKKEQKEARDSWELASKGDPNGKEGKKSFVFYNCSENSSGKRKNNRDAELINFVDLLNRTKGEESIPPVEEEQVVEAPVVKEDSHIFTIEDVEDEEGKGLFDDPMLHTGEERLRWPDEERVFSENEEENMDSDRMADGYRPGEEPEEDEGSSIQDWMKEPEISSGVSEEEVHVAVNNHYLQTETSGEVDEPVSSSRDPLEEEEEDEDNITASEENVLLTGELEKSEELLQETERPEQWQQAEDSVVPVEVEYETPGKAVEVRETENQEKQETVKIEDSELFGVQHDESRPDTSEFEELFGASEPDYKEQKKESYSEDLFNGQTLINTDQAQPGKAVVVEKPADQGKNKIIGSILTASFLITLLTISVFLVYT